jgi:hypothetical protein
MSSHRLCLALLAVGLACLPACDREPPLPAVNAGSATAPTPPVPLSMPTEKPALKAPHNGRLTAMSDGRGYVEWVVHAGRLYFLDPSGGPLKGAEAIVLTFQSATGPRQSALAPCDDPAFAGACWTAPGGELREKAPEALLRFLLDGQPVRVALSEEGRAATSETTAVAPLDSPSTR